MDSTQSTQTFASFPSVLGREPEAQHDAYERPAIIELGSLAELTRGGGAIQSGFDLSMSLVCGSHRVIPACTLTPPATDRAGELHGSCARGPVGAEHTRDCLRGPVWRR